MPKITTPEWVKDAVFYQIFPDRFAKSDQVLKPNNLEPWDTPPTEQGYKGGDLYGVIEHLDHIQALGCNAIYFTPIFQSACNHRYHTHDYYQVDPLLGGNKAFYALRDALHQRGMKLVLDGVFNHASRGHIFFSDILENGPHSAWLDWFTVYDWPLSAYDGSKPANYEAWVGNRALPKWNTDNPQVREYIMQIAEHWLNEGIDGWRLDVPFCVTSPGFWNEFRDRVKAINPDAYIVGEVWGDSTNYLQGDQFDAVMNYLFTEPVIQFCGQENIVFDLVKDRSYDPYPGISGKHFGVKLNKTVFRYEWEVAQVQLNLLSSHDTSRILSILNEDKAATKLAALFLMTVPGAPSIYYGDEIGLPGGNDPDCRRTIPWDKPETWDTDMLAHYQTLTALRHQYPALRRGRFVHLHDGEKTYAFGRELDGEVLLVAANAGKKSQKVTIPVHDLFADGATLKMVFGTGEVTVSEGQVALTLAPQSGVILARAE
ncbi:MAG: alpha-glucosidase C-terminal domain-containing protein [Anaerolineaceae bacterium]|nr:alpha-glucosidase C-terminal domain-containing protein [Anaerolineaceae bacterium]